MCKKAGACPHQKIQSSGVFSIHNIIAVITVILAAGLSAIFLSTIYEPRPTVSTVYVHDKLLTSAVVSRDSIKDYLEVSQLWEVTGKRYLYTEFCIDVDVYHGTIATGIEVESNYTVNLDTLPVSLPAGCYKASVPITIPESIPEGSYRFFSRLSGQLNLFNTFDTILFKAPITILN